MSSYSRVGYLALIAEDTENTAKTPTVFIPLMSEDIVTEWGETPAKPIAANRVLNLRPINTAIPAPSGTINILVEPKTIGYFLKAIFGAVTSGQLMTVTGASGNWAAGNTVTGASSAKTATVVAVSSELDYLLISSPSGAFTDGETINNGSTGTATLVQHDATVYGHQFTAPQSSLPTYTVEISLGSEAYRYTGVRFTGLTANQSDNIIAAAISMSARAEFKMARITVAESSGAGAHTLSLDQTTGLAASDTIKVYRPGTGYLDFSAENVKTHTVGTVASETSITITNLQTSLQVGDLIVLAPQTPSYTIDSEFIWIGGSTVKLDDTLSEAIAATADTFEEFELMMANDGEYKHGANGVNVVNRFPAKYFLKGITGTGKLNRTYTDQTYLDRLRNGSSNALQIKHTGGQIGSTGQYYGLDWRIPNGILKPFNPSLSEDDLLNQEMQFDMYYSTTSGFLAKALLITDVSSY